MSENDEIAKEIEAENRRREKNNEKPLKIERGQLTGAKVAWIAGAIAIDAATSYAIWQITFWWYGLAWLLAGAGGLIYSNWLRERIGNNFDQKEIARYGMNISWISIVFMGLVSGVVYILGFTKNPYVEVLTIVVTLGLFFYHVFQSYRFQTKDDEYIEKNEEARELEDHARELRKIHRAARKVDGKKKERGVVWQYKHQHGDAFTAAYGKDVEKVELKDSHPNSPAGKSQD